MSFRYFFISLLVCIPLVAGAQMEEEDAAFDQSVRDFGFTSGAVLQCAKTSERGVVEAEALRAYSGLVRLFGSDQAFFYAAAFGAGSTMAIDKSKCSEYSKAFNKAMSKNKTQ
jgi:hypothetical protein